MEPKFGRAAWIPERARGTKDAGAIAWALWVDALAEGCIAASTRRAQKLPDMDYL